MCTKKCWGHGFQNLQHFNTATLAKQVWWLLINPHSRVALTIKAKYHPKSFILQAGLGNHPSYVWKSLQSSINLIKSGARRRVGSGEDVIVWTYPWVPNSHPFITTTPLEGPEDWPVSALKYVQRNSWDEALLNAVFDTRDFNLIRSIPLSLRSTARPMVGGGIWNGKEFTPLKMDMELLLTKVITCRKGKVGPSYGS